MVRKGPLSFINPLLKNESFFMGPILGSLIYHDLLWYPIIGKRRIKNFMQTKWGDVFKNYPEN